MIFLVRTKFKIVFEMVENIEANLYPEACFCKKSIAKTSAFDYA